jgi:Ca-activated chloride channel family protein
VKFAAPYWLFGSFSALLVALLLLLGGVGLRRAAARFGVPERIAALVTFDASSRRTVKGVLLVLAVALAFVALARPQYSRGQKLVPATNLDVVVILDFSKSMYARDVVPSRIARAKAEVARMVRELSGARFGAVAFAGEPLGFPLTSDGAAIAQFLRQIEPNDMPVGGTAIGRALERAREIMLRDPKAKDHRKVFLLITDGEDLEGNPAEVARTAAADGISVHVVQIGGRTPERIPDVGPDGRVVSWRVDETGKPLTTQLTPEGEAQLADIARSSGGKLVRSERGNTGIDDMTRHLKAMMTSELAERVETVYDDKFAWPLGLALILLVIETFLNEAPRRFRPPPAPATPREARRAALPQGRRPRPRPRLGRRLRLRPQEPLPAPVPGGRQGHPGDGRRPGRDLHRTPRRLPARLALRRRQPESPRTPRRGERRV